MTTYTITQPRRPKMNPKRPCKLNILGLFNQKHHPELVEPHSPILPDELIVQEEDIPKRIKSEIMSGIIASLLGDNIDDVITILNQKFKKNINTYPLITSDNEYKQMKKIIKNPEYADGVIYTKGYTPDSVHFYFEHKDGVYDGYTQIKQMNGGHQYCQGHALAFAYFPEYRQTFDSTKEKTWFQNGNLYGAYKEAYIELLNIFEEIIPLILQSFTKKKLIAIINQILKDQHCDTLDGGEYPCYYPLIKTHTIDFLKLLIKKPKIVCSRKNDGIPQIKQKGTTAKISQELANNITNYILTVSRTDWAIKYMSAGYYVDFDKVDDM